MYPRQLRRGQKHLQIELAPALRRLVGMRQISLTSVTSAWRFQSWAAFLISLVATTVGLIYLPIDVWPKAFVGTGLLFTVSSCFVLAKTLRDEHESQRIQSRLDEAQAEKLLREID